MSWYLSTLKGWRVRRCSLVVDLPSLSAVCQDLWSTANWSRCVLDVSTFSSYFTHSVPVFRYKMVCVCVCVLDPRWPPADVHCQPEGGDFYWGEERRSQSDCSVSKGPSICLFSLSHLSARCVGSNAKINSGLTIPAGPEWHVRFFGICCIKYFFSYFPSSSDIVSPLVFFFNTFILHPTSECVWRRVFVPTAP